MVNNLSHPNECFSSVFVDDIYAYFGTQSGSLCIYHLNTFKLQAHYPYLHSLRKKYVISPGTTNEPKHGPAIINVFKSRKPGLKQN
jgi:hypothetical protein